jgi:hypothetical protein
VLILAGCATTDRAAADLGLAGLGGVAGYQLSDHQTGGAAIGAALGYLGSRVAQDRVQHAQAAAERRGYERALNQAVKQQYWLIQSRQRERPTAVPDSKLIPVHLPETTTDGVIQTARVEYLRVQS